MDELLVGPRLEKRIMPLLDVALSLVGVLILMVSVSNESRESGIEGNVARIDVRENGDVAFGVKTLATTKGGIDNAEMEQFFRDLEQLKKPLVLMYYTRPTDTEQFVNWPTIQACIEMIEARGFNLKSIGRETDERVRK